MPFIAGERVRWGIVGCGDVTEVKSGPAMQRARGSALVAVMRRRADLAADYARRHSVPRWYGDADALIGDAEVDAVYVATPPDSHRDYTLRAAAAGKAVYVEKPMALTAAQCQEMVAACRAAGVPLFVAYYRRRLPLFLKVEELLREGAIGQVRSVRILHCGAWAPAPSGSLPWRLVPEIAGKGGLFHDLGSHQLDLLDYLLGPIAQAHGVAVNQAGHYRCDDAIAAAWRHTGGIVGSGLWTFCADDGSRGDRIDILGSLGRLTFAAFDLSRPVRLERAGRAAEEIGAPVPAHVQQPLIQTAVDDLLGRGTCPSTGDTALRTARVTDCILGVD